LNKDELISVAERELCGLHHSSRGFIEGFLRDKVHNKQLRIDCEGTSIIFDRATKVDSVKSLFERAL
jgi:hypothetical protein